MRLFLSYLIVLLFPVLTLAVSNVTELPRPDRWVQVTDPQGLIDEATKQEINQLLENHRINTTDQISVVVVDKIENTTPKQFAVDLYQAWQIGEKGKDNGLLILLSMNDRRVEFEVGYGLEGDLPDITCKRIQSQSMVPEFQNGNYAAGLLAGVKTTIAVLEKREVLTPEPAAASAPTKEELRRNFFIVMGCILGGGFILFAIFLYAAGKSLKTLLVVVPFAMFFFIPTIFGFIEELNLKGWMIWLTLYLMIAVVFTLVRLIVRKKMEKNLSVQQKYSHIFEEAFPKWSLIVFPFPAFLVRLWEKALLRKYRNHPQHCSRCNSPMRLLSNVDELKHLNHSQKVEQQIESVDHDVWFCDKDSHIQIFHAKELGTQYDDCKKCSAIAYYLDSDVVTNSATYETTGSGIKTFKCKACNHTEKQNYTIPVKTRSSSSSSSGGSSSSSSYSGGGRSGGGGAGSSW